MARYADAPRHRGERNPVTTGLVSAELVSTRLLWTKEGTEKEDH
jgi:hypothetical protein